MFFFCSEPDHLFLNHGLLLHSVNRFPQLLVEGCRVASLLLRNLFWGGNALGQLHRCHWCRWGLDHLRHLRGSNLLERLPLRCCDI